MNATPAPNPAAERFEHRLFSGEPSCQSFRPIASIADLFEFGLNEATWDERVARIFNPAPHLGDVYQVDAMSENVHKARLSLRHAKDTLPPTLWRLP